MTTSIASRIKGNPNRRGSSGPARTGSFAMLVLLPAYVPFALLIGAAAAARGESLAGWAGSLLIFGGSAQLAAIRVMDRSGPEAAVLTGLLVNARLLVYSASLARRWTGQPRWFRVVAAGLIIDPTWAAAELHAEGCGDLGEQRRYFLGAGFTLAAGWSAATAIGVLMGADLGPVNLDVFAPLCLLGLVGGGFRVATTRAVMVAAGLVALITANWPNGTGLISAIIAGAAAGMANDRRSHR